MLAQILIALGLTAVTVLIHAVGTVLSIRRLTRVVHRRGSRHPMAFVAPAAMLVTSLLLLSVVEVLVWAAVYHYAGQLPDFETAVYFSFTSYTTVGYGDVVLPLGGRLLGPIESAVGVLMFGWSTGVLVAAISRMAAALAQPAADAN
jgi:voltage-gated potassium channel